MIGCGTLALFLAPGIVTEPTELTRTVEGQVLSSTEMPAARRMIIYMEDLAPEGAAAGRWDEISRGLLERALGGFEISR